MRTSIRSLFATVFMALGFAAIGLAPRRSVAQDQPEAKRKVVTRVVPAYPELAGKMQITGTVRLEVVVAANGKMKSFQVIGGSPVLSKAAVDAIDKWKWVAAPQETKEILEFNFHPQ
jgi:TonB family protein